MPSTSSLDGPQSASPSIPHPPFSPHPTLPYSSPPSHGTYYCTVPRNDHNSTSPDPIPFFDFVLRIHKKQRHTKSTGWVLHTLLSPATAPRCASHRSASHRIAPHRAPIPTLQHSPISLTTAAVALDLGQRVTSPPATSRARPRPLPPPPAPPPLAKPVACLAACKAGNPLADSFPTFKRGILDIWISGYPIWVLWHLSSTTSLAQSSRHCRRQTGYGTARSTRDTLVYDEESGSATIHAPRPLTAAVNHD